MAASQAAKGQCLPGLGQRPGGRGECPEASPLCSHRSRLSRPLSSPAPSPRLRPPPAPPAAAAAAAAAAALRAKGR